MSEKGDKEIREWKNRLDALQFISRTHRAVRNQRRSMQFKVFLTVSTFYALIGAAKFTGKLQTPQSHQCCFYLGAWVLVIAVATLSSIYLLGINAANHVNRKLAEKAETAIMQMVDLPGPEKAGRTIAKTYFWEIAMIVIFAVAVGLSITIF